MIFREHHKHKDTEVVTVTVIGKLGRATTRASRVVLDATTHDTVSAIIGEALRKFAETNPAPNTSTYRKLPSWERPARKTQPNAKKK